MAATVAALEAWLATDHAARWEGYGALASALAERLSALPGARCALRRFTLDERLVDGPVNAVVLAGARGPRGRGRRAGRRRPVRARLVVDGDARVLHRDAARTAELGEITGALRSVWQA